jgi:hypothetical protein
MILGLLQYGNFCTAINLHSLPAYDSADLKVSQREFSGFNMQFVCRIAVEWL